MYCITDEIMARKKQQLEVLISQCLVKIGNATCYITNRKTNLK